VTSRSPTSSGSGDVDGQPPRLADHDRLGLARHETARYQRVVQPWRAVMPPRLPLHPRDRRVRTVVRQGLPDPPGDRDRAGPAQVLVGYEPQTAREGHQPQRTKPPHRYRAGSLGVRPQLPVVSLQVLLDEGQARYVRMAGYEVPVRDGDGKGEVIALVTTISAMTAAAAGIDPDRVTFKPTVRIVRRRAADPAAFPPEHQERILATVMAGITRTKHLNPERRHRTYPRVIKRARHNSYRVQRPGDHGTRHSGPATIKLDGLHLPALAA
jgi:hypothetical protein